MRTAKVHKVSALILAVLIALLAGIAGQVLAQTVSYEYDNLQRLTRATYADGMVIQYQYDAAGNRTVYSVTRPSTPGTLQLSATTYSVSETGPVLTVLVTRASGSFGTASVQYATSNGSATAGSDYTATSGTLTWTDGDSAPKSVMVPILDDAAYEGSETFSVQLTNATGAALGAPASAVVTIADNDNPPPGTLQFSPSSYTVSESVGSVPVTVSRANGSAGAASVSYSTSNGTATAGSDYTSASGTLSWDNGDGADKTFNVAVVDDAAPEGSETINLTLTNASGASLGTPATATITISDNDSASVPGIPAGIHPGYQFVIAGCPIGQMCPSFSGGVGGATSVTWNPPVGGPPVHHYELQRALNSANFSANLLTVFSGDALSWIPSGFVGANPTNWYYFRVRACNTSNQCSSWREVSIWEVCAGGNCNAGM